MKELRLNKGLTQNQLAKRTKLTQERISQLENGDVYGLTLGKAQKIAKALNMCDLNFIGILLGHECKHICKLWKEDG